MIYRYEKSKNKKEYPLIRYPAVYPGPAPVSTIIIGRTFGKIKIWCIPTQNHNQTILPFRNMD